MQKISTKFIALIIITLISVGGLSLFIKIDQLKKDEIKLQDKNIQRLVKRLQLNLSLPIWNLQTDLINDIINTEALNDFIDSIIVIDEDANEIARYISKNIEAKHHFYLNFDIKYENKIISNIKIKYNDINLVNKINSQIKILFIEDIITIFVLIIIIKSIVDKLLSRRVVLLSKKVHDFKIKRIINNNIEDLNSKDEIGFLAKEFNNMQKELQKNWNELKELNNSLENRIKEEVEKNRQKELQIIEQAKLAQMGEMIGNIAHQWRQPLSAISTIASGMTIQKEIGILNDDLFYKNMDNIVDKVMFLSETIDTFRNFTISDKSLSDINIANSIKEILLIVGKTLENDEIVINKKLDDTLIYKGYKGELSQVLINILNNAKDAYKNKNIEDKFIDINLYKYNNTIKIDIKDNAGGIKDDIVKKIFEPYFTTKHQSQGTGIGLYMCKRLLNKNNGDIFVKNIKNGAIFTIELYTK